MQPLSQLAHASEGVAGATPAIVKRFRAAERLLAFESGRLEVLTLGGRTIGKGSYAPGWRWSQCAAGSSPLRRGSSEHVGLVLSGRARVRSREGGEVDLAAGDVFQATITDEYDMWVAGPRPCEILYLSGVQALIRELRGPA
jgi:hypothetical protein